MRSINVAVPDTTHNHIKSLATEHDIVTLEKNPNITGAARDFLMFLCRLDALPGVAKLKEEGLTLKEIISESVHQRTRGDQ